MSDYGELLDDTTVRFERLLPGPIDRVWSYLTDPDKRGRWLAGGKTEHRTGGRLELVFENKALSTQPDIEPPEKYSDMPDIMSFGGDILVYEPPTKLVHTWEYVEEYSEVTYELEEVGDKVRLVLTHRRLHDRTEIMGACGGWHTHLDILDDILRGNDPRPFWSNHTRLEADYEQRLGS